MFFRKALMSITGRKRQNARQLKAIVEALDRSMLMVKIDPSGTIFKCNSNFGEVFGGTIDNVIGIKESSFYANNQDDHSLLQAIAQNRSIAGTFKRRAFDGRPVWLEGSYTPLKNLNGQMECIVFYAVDVTQKVVSEHEFQRILAAATSVSAIIEFDPQGNILEANERYLNLMGYTAHEIIGKTHKIFCEPEFVASGSYRAFWADLQGGNVLNGLFKRIDHRGDIVWLEATYQPVFDGHGKLLKVVKFASDVTRRVNAIEHTPLGVISTDTMGRQTEDLADVALTIVDRKHPDLQNIFRGIDSASTLVADLSGRSKQLSKILDSVGELAQQVNLLMLNIAIETVAVDDQGRGYATVINKVHKITHCATQLTAKIPQITGFIQPNAHAQEDSTLMQSLAQSSKPGER